MTIRKTFARRTAIIAATTALLSGGVVAPTAQAQNIGNALGAFEIIRDLNNAAIETVDCKTLDAGLKLAKLKDANTTRSQLEKNIRKAVPTAGNFGLTIFKADAAGKWADRALKCGLVKADPFNPLAGSTDALGSLDIIKDLIPAQR